MSSHTHSTGMKGNDWLGVSSVVKAFYGMWVFWQVAAHEYNEERDLREAVCELTRKTEKQKHTHTSL